MEYKKRVSESRTEMIHLLVPGNLNHHNRLYGGQLLKWLDEAAAITAMRHSEGEVMTAGIDHLDFKAGAVLGDRINIHGYVTYVGRTSMEVRLDTYAEKIDGDLTLINMAYFVMVGVDENFRPREVPGLILETDAERAEWDAALKRKEHRKERGSVKK